MWFYALVDVELDDCIQDDKPVLGALVHLYIQAPNYEDAKLQAPTLARERTVSMGVDPSSLSTTSVDVLRHIRRRPRQYNFFGPIIEPGFVFYDGSE